MIKYLQETYYFHDEPFGKYLSIKFIREKNFKKLEKNADASKLQIRL